MNKLIKKIYLSIYDNDSRTLIYQTSYMENQVNLLDLTEFIVKA